MKKHFDFVFLFLLIIYFPTYSQNNKLEEFANFNKYSEANKKLPTLKPGEKRIVFVGDSITEFWESSFFPDNLYVNRGISGQTTPQMLLRFRNDVLNLQPYAVVILAGINDIAENTGPYELKNVFVNIVSMCQLAEANGIKVILCSVLPADDITWNKAILPAEKIIKLNDMLKEYCNKNKITYVDYYSKMVDEKKGLNKKYSDDGVHPNAAGYKVMEPIVKKAIKNLIGN